MEKGIIDVRVHIVGVVDIDGVGAGPDRVVDRFEGVEKPGAPLELRVQRLEGGSAAD